MLPAAPLINGASLEMTVALGDGCPWDKQHQQDDAVECWQVPAYAKVPKSQLNTDKYTAGTSPVHLCVSIGEIGIRVINMCSVIRLLNPCEWFPA